MDRSKEIIKVSIIGIIINVILVAIKAMVGLVTGSIAVILDAVNNLSDALGSIITIIGAKLAAKEPDKKHPFGYGQVEHITSIVIAAVVALAAITSFKESVDKIIHPEPATYGVVSILLIVVSVFVKFFAGRYVKNEGKKLNAQALIASGSEAFLDAVVSASTLVAAGISLLFGLSLEGFLGAIIAILILKTAFEILTESLSGIIGERVGAETTNEIKAFIRDRENVLGAYDLILHKYGPEKIIGSVHIEVPDDLTAKDIHVVTRDIMQEVYEKFGIILTVGIYATNNTDEKYQSMRDELSKIIGEFSEILSFHAFYVDEKRKVISVDIVVDFKAENKFELPEKITSYMKKKYSEYEYSIAIDSDFSD